jgi:hypothetical protein
MPPIRRSILLATIFALEFLTACQSTPTSRTEIATGSAGASTQNAQSAEATCDCTTYPFKPACSSQCFLATGIIEQVTADSVTVSVPSITSTSTGERIPQIARRTFTINPDEAKQLQSIKQGTRIALTFHQQSGQDIAKSIRELPAEPPK